MTVDEVVPLTHPDPRIQQLAEGIWIYLPEWQRLEPTIGLVSTGEGWVLIDSGNSPAHARRVLDAMRRIRDVPVAYVINTHRHFDHAFGNQAFDAPVIASQQCRRRFRANLDDDWAPHRVQRWLRDEMLPHVPTLALADFEGLAPVPPSVSFQSSMTLDVGETELRLFPSHGAHSDDHISAFLPEQQILFISDTFYFHESEGQITRWLKLLDELVHYEAETIVPGHEPPYDRMTFELLRAYGHELLEVVISAIRSETPEDEIVQIPLSKRYDRIPFLNAKTHRRLVQAAYRELTQSA